MKVSTLKYNVLSWASFLTILIIVVMPFHAFLTVWGSHLIGHYTLLRLWKEFLLVLLGGFALFLVATDRKIRTHTLSRRLVWLILAYGVVVILWGLWALRTGNVTRKALGYGLIVDLRFLAFFLVTWAASLRLSRLHSHWQWMVLWPAAIVVTFGILQFFVLPQNFLSHFGYGPNTIPPFETINHNQQYIRILSTLRGANPLGAYLLVPISMLAVLLLRRTLQGRQLVLLLACLVCLFLTFSRSAWIGALLSLAIVATVCITGRRARRIALVAAGVLATLILIGTLALHNDTRFQNFAFHTQTHSAVSTTSDQGHASALRAGIHDLVHQPLGRGTGTAGPASYYNGSHPVRIAENYFLQIGQETGWIGLILFLLINAGVALLLWLRRTDSLALSLIAALAGITLINGFSHAWTDDTLAYIWWGLAGIAMAPNLKELRDQTRNSGQA